MNTSILNYYPNIYANSLSDSIDWFSLLLSMGLVFLLLYTPAKFLLHVRHCNVNLLSKYSFFFLYFYKNYRFFFYVGVNLLGNCYFILLLSRFIRQEWNNVYYRKNYLLYLRQDFFVLIQMLHECCVPFWLVTTGIGLSLPGINSMPLELFFFRSLCCSRLH